MLTSGLGADIVVVCTHFPLWRVLSMESFQSSTSYESDKLERPTVISNSPGMQPSSAVRPIVNGKVSAFRSTMREPGITSSAVSSGKNDGEHPALARYWVNAASSQRSLLSVSPAAITASSYWSSSIARIDRPIAIRSEEHTSELQSLIRNSHA